jgi:hypothetical protein
MSRFGRDSLRLTYLLLQLGKLDITVVTPNEKINANNPTDLLISLLKIYPVAEHKEKCNKECSS